MQCPNCNNEVLPGELFCDNCGQDLKEVQAAAMAAPAPPAQTPPAPAVAPQTPVPPSPVAPSTPSTGPIPAGQTSAAPAAPATPATPPPAPPPAASAPPAQPSDPAAVAAPVVEPITPPAPPATPAPVQTGPRLVLKDGSASYTLAMGKVTTLGRLDPVDGIFPDIDLTPHDVDTGVSRRHASIHEQGGQWFITDLNSTNYTVVSRQRLTPQQDFLIEDGDEIRFSRVVFTFRTS